MYFDLFWKPLVCRKCGGTMRTPNQCPYCGTNYAIDWTAVRPAPSGEKPEKKKYYPGRDRRVDAVILALLAKQAFEEQVEVSLHLSYDGHSSSLDILVRDKEYDKWEKVGSIDSSSVGGELNYYIDFSPGLGFYDNSSAYGISWTESFGDPSGARMYRLWDRKSFHCGDASHVRGEDELYVCGPLRSIIRKMVHYAYFWIEWKQKQEAEEAYRARIAALSPLRRLLHGWGIDQLS